MNLNLNKSIQENILRKNKKSLTHEVGIKDRQIRYSNKSGISQIFVFKICKFKRTKRFDFCDFQKFIIHFDNNLSILKYFKICNDLENMKNILFEENIKIFNSIKPNLNSSLCSSENYNLFQNRKTKNKSDRIITNLLNIANYGTHFKKDEM